MDREVWYHGEDIPIHLTVTNNSRKACKSIRVRRHLGFFCHVISHAAILCSGKVQVEAGLDKEVFYHGEDVPVHITINNNSNKKVNSLSVRIEL